MKVHLSDGEWKLMNKLWDASPRTITELTAALREETGWSKNTVITMLSRLDAKQAVYYEEGLRAKQYYPAVINLMEGYGNDNPAAKSQGIKQLMAGGGVVLIGTTLIPLLSGLFG